MRDHSNLANSMAKYSSPFKEGKKPFDNELPQLEELLSRSQQQFSISKWPKP
jgi:hypothetical protein